MEWDDEWADYQQELVNIRNSGSTPRDNWAFARHVVENDPTSATAGLDPQVAHMITHLDGTGVDYVHQETKFRFDPRME